MAAITVQPDPEEIDDSFLDVPSLVGLPSLVGPYAPPEQVVQDPKEKTEPVVRWYELDALLPYRDLVGLVGFLLFVASVSTWSWRVGLGIAGAAMMALAWLMAKAKKA